MSTDWNKRAEGYDRLGWVRDATSMGRLGAILRNVYEHSSPVRTVDLGCGTGAVTELLLDMGLQHDVVSVDASSAMLERCAARVGESDRWAAERDDAGTWTCDVPPDIITARMLLHHMPDPEGALARWFGLLAPGGALVIAESVLPVDDHEHPAAKLCQQALEIKEPGRHHFTPTSIAALMPGQRADSHVEIYAWKTRGNSMRNWLEGDPSISEKTRKAIETLHHLWAKTPEVRAAYEMEIQPDGDILMTWRHCVVVAWRV